MSDILSSVLTFPVRIILILTVVILIGLWIVSIVWVNRDAKTREAPVTLWTAVAIVPVPAWLPTACCVRPSTPRIPLSRP